MQCFYVSAEYLINYVFLGIHLKMSSELGASDGLLPCIWDDDVGNFPQVLNQASYFPSNQLRNLFGREVSDEAQIFHQNLKCLGKHNTFHRVAGP
jgi:hypothetical protein